MTDPAIVRFAPSPTGPPHLGNLRTALFDWLLARATGGRFLLRIDDTDQSRYNPSAEADMMGLLRWLGLDWDEGPDAGGPHAPYRQSERLLLYQQAAEKLIEVGHAFRPADEPDIVRLKTPSSGTITLQDAIRGEIQFDFDRVPQNPVLIKSDGFPTYHLATVVDDWAMGITHVLRGEEWIPSTPLHLQMFEALEYPPPQFIHLPLVTDHEGKKLKKRDPSFEARTYREAGFLPEAVVNYLALLGWHPGTEQEIFSPQELIESFTIANFQKSPAAFNEDRLRWFNQQHMMRLSDDDLMRRALPFLEAVYPDAAAHNESWIITLIHAVREELITLADAPASTGFAFEYGPLTEDAQTTLRTEQALPVISAFQSAAEALQSFDSESTSGLLRELRSQFKASYGWGGRAVMFPLRAALTGSIAGPHLSDVVALLGKAETLRRIEHTLAIMKS